MGPAGTSNGVIVAVLVFMMFPCTTGQMVRFVGSVFHVEEGEQFSVQVELLGTITETIRVIVEIVGDTENDFIGDTQVATFNPSSQISEVTFTVNDDEEPENTELFYIKILFISPGLYVGDPSTASVTVAANDNAYGVFGFKETSPMIVQEEMFTLVVSLRVERTVSYFNTVGITFEVNSTSVDGILGEDITPATGTVTFGPNQRESFLQLQILPETLPENDESFVVTLTRATYGARIINSELVLIIQANDAPIRFTQGTYMYDEGPGTKSWSVDVTRGTDEEGNIVGPLTGVVSVQYKFEMGTALPGNDFTADDGELVFQPGETLKTISFVINDDEIPEIKETFKIRLLTLFGNAVFVNPNVAEVIINANDYPSGVITFKPVSEGSPDTLLVKANEDTFTTVNFTVLRTEGTFGVVSVGWYVLRADRTSVSVALDVGPTEGRLVFGDGENMKMIQLTIVQDSLPEPAEQFDIFIQNISLTGNAQVRGITVAKLIIEDSDNVYGVVEFGPDTSHRIDTSTSPRTLQLSLTRNGGRLETALVNVTVSYLYNGVEVSPEIIFDEWQVTATLPPAKDPIIVSIDLLPSAFLTIGGQFVAKLDDVRLETEPPYGYYNSPTLGMRRQTTVVVSEAEANGESGFNSTASIVVEEPASGVLEIPLLIVREGMIGSAAIRWSVTGVASSLETVNNLDVAPMSGIVSIPSGSSSVNLIINILADDIPELDETMVVRLLSIDQFQTQRLRPGATEVYITVLRNDNPGGVFQFATSMNDSYSVAEGTGSINVVVERTGGDLETRMVEFMVEPNGTSEFYGSPNALVFPPGVRTRGATILPKNEGEPELEEYYTLHLISLENATLGERTTINITVLESDYPYGRIQFKESPAVYLISETVQGQPVNVTIAVQRDHGTFNEVTVPWKLSPETEEDLIPSSGVIVFSPGQSSYDLVLQTVDDDISEGPEVYVVQLERPTGGAVPGIPMVATITIRENDNPVEFTETLVYMEEPGTHQFTVKRSGQLDTAVSVAYRTLDGSASTLQNDYVQIFGETLYFAPGESTKSFNVTVLDDAVPEGNETFTMELFDATGDLLITNNSRTTVVILANDDAYGVFSFETPTSISVEEGSTIFYNIIRNQGIFGEVAVSWEIQTPQNTPVPEGSEFQSTRGVLVFQPQEARKALGITPLTDQLPEGQEAYQVVLTSVTVVTGLASRSLAKLALSNLKVDLIVLASDDPYGLFAFPLTSQELSIAEDYYPGDESSTTTTYTVERRQGTDGEVQVLWEILPDAFGTNLPHVYDLLFIGQKPATVTSVPSKQRPGSGTHVYSFSGAQDSYVTIPPALQPTADDLSQGFTVSAWVQPSPMCDGYIVSRSNTDGTSQYYGLRLTATALNTTLDMTISATSSLTNTLNPVVSGTVVQDGRWHHVLVAVANISVQFYLDGALVSSSAVNSGIPQSGPGAMLVGAKPPGADHFVGYMQDVRIWARTLDLSEVELLYQPPPLSDVTPVSGILTYAPGVRTGSFSVQSLQDIEEEGDKVFAVRLVATTGGATLSTSDALTTLTVLKSDNANGLFRFREPCTPLRVAESSTVVCNVLRQKGDDGTVTVTWLIQQRSAQGLTSATSDFNNVTGSLVFLRGERFKTFEVQVTEEMVPELDELFEISLVSAVPNDGVVGSTNTSGASIDSFMDHSEVTIIANDYPYGLLQFGKEVGVPPTLDANGLIAPADGIPTVRVGEEGGTISLVVERAQGTLGAVSVEWRTIDRTAVSEGKLSPDYVGAAGRVDFTNGQLYAFVNITVKDNSLPEGEKVFQVELVNPTGGAAIGLARFVNVSINASDNAYGVYQFGDNAVEVIAQETGDVGYVPVFLRVVRLGGTIGADTVTWQVTEDTDDGLDLTENSGTVSFSAGESEANLEIRIRGDSVPELDEIVKVGLVGVAKGALGNPLKLTSTVTIEANDDPYGSFDIGNLNRPLRVNEEAKDVTITVRRRYGTFGIVTVSYETLEPTETYSYLPGPLIRADNQDFVATSGNITFQAGQEFGTFSVAILDDVNPEQDESIFVRLTSAVLIQAAQTRIVPNSPRLSPESESYAQIIITSNDDASGVLQLSPTALTVSEDVGIPQLSVVRSGGTFGLVKVPFRAIDGEALNQQDFYLTSSEVILSPGETSKLVPLIINNDLVPELSESFTIELLDQITGGATLGENWTAVITIEPSDDPNGVFDFATTGLSVQEPENNQPYTIDITVIRTGGSVDVVNLQWIATLNGEALNSDITPTSGSVFFLSNEGSLPITVSVLPDDIPEGTENIVIRLVSATNGGRIGARNTFQLTITPNDSPHGYVQFAKPTYTVDEGPLAPQYLQLNRSGGTYGQLRVYYSTKPVEFLTEATQDGSTSLSYFNDPVSGQRALPGAVVNVSWAADPLMACSSACLESEVCRAFQVDKSSDSLVCSWFPDIVSNVQLIPAINVSVYNIDLDKVQQVLSRIARPGEDYTSVTDSSILIPDGNTTGELPVLILDDSIPELSEKFSVVLLRVEVDDPSAVTQDKPHLGNLSTASVFIVNNDNAHGAFKIYSDSPSANQQQKTVSYEETSNLAVSLIVEREGGSIGEVTVTWQERSGGRTATSGVDYQADGATLTFAPGQTRRFVTIMILDDTLPEDDESFTIELTNPTGGASLSSDSYITVIILANDYVAGVLGFNTTSVLAAEGDQFSMGVLRAQSTLGTVHVNWTIEGLNGLQPQLGFQTITGTLIFLPGEGEKPIPLVVLADDTPEINEEYLLKLSGITTEGIGATGAAIISPQLGAATITIQSSNDPHGVLQFASASRTVVVAEDAGVATLQVDRKFGAIGMVRVTYEAVQGTVSTLTADLNLASPGQDFVTVSSGIVDFANGVTSANINITIIDDLLPEIDEVFMVRLTAVSLEGSGDNASPPRLAANGTVAEVLIGANDGAQGVLVFASDSRRVDVDEQSTRITLTVLRTEGTFGRVSVSYYSQSITENTIAGTDYIVEPGTLTFEPGESQKLIAIEIINDGLPEPDEQFEVVLSNPEGGVILGQFPRASVTILANDGSAGQVTFVSPARVELQEPTGGNQTGSKAVLSVQRGPGIYGRVIVPFAITNSFNVPTSDVSPANGVVIFEDRQATAVIELTAVSDEDPETEETFTVKLQTPTGGAVLGAITTATVIVQPNDSPYGLFQIFIANTSLSNIDVEENVGTIHLDIKRLRGILGRVSIDVATSAATATYLNSSTNIVIADFQSVPAAKISAWHTVQSGGTTFVLMLTSLTGSEQLRTLLPATSPVENGQSVLFRWQGELMYVRTLATDGATAADSFSIAGTSYFIITNAGKEGAREVQSILYRLSADGSVEVVQGLTTYGATDVKYFEDNGQHFLAVANSLDDSSKSDIKSFVYTWNPVTQKFGASPTEQISTLYARAVEIFTIDSTVYLVMANYYDTTSSSFQIDSVVYRKESDGSFIEHQRLATAGAVDVTYFTVNSSHFLALANNRETIISSPQTSHLYRWDTTTRFFQQFQDLSTTRVSAITSLTLQDGTALLVIANSVGASDVMQWNVSQNRFDTVWSGDPFLLLQPITIQQPVGPLYLLAAASASATDYGRLFQVARIRDGSDFVQRSVTMTFEPGQTELHMTAVVLPDEIPEDTESFTVDIIAARDGGEIGPQNLVSINILSNDNAHGIIQFAPDSRNKLVEEKEGTDNPVLLTVEREGGFFGHVSVLWETDGDHRGLLDISPLSGKVEFADGQSSTIITLMIKDDNVAEFAEVTYVRLTRIEDNGSSVPSQGAQLGPATQAKVTVLANDSPYGVVSWQTTEMVIPEPEGTDQTLPLVITREQGLLGQLRVSYVTSMALDLPPPQQAKPGEDFVPTQSSVIFNANAREATVSVTIKQDDIPETAETFLVNITEVTLVVPGGDTSAQPSIRVPGDVMRITILKNDNAQGTVQFDVNTNIEGRVDVYEEYGRNSTVSLLLRRSVGFFGSLVVDWQTFSITADNFDFYPIVGSVQFEEQQQTAEINITILEDQVPEEMEMFDVKLLRVSGDAVLGNVTSVRIAIIKNDSPTGLFRFSTREVEIQESQSLTDSRGRANLVVQRLQGSQGVVNVRWRLNAEAQEDFIAPLEGTLQFSQGETEKILRLQSKPDIVLEGRETFQVSLHSPDNNADISPTEGDATIIILPDPGASGIISIVPTSRSVLIGEPGEYSPTYDGTAGIQLVRGVGIYGVVTVSWALTPRDTNAFMQIEGSVTFSDQQETAFITLQARDDSSPEVKAFYILQLTSATGGATISSSAGAAESRVTFVASDFPHGLFEFTLPETMTVSEDQTSVQVIIRRTKGLIGQVQVSYTTVSDTATSGQDFYPAADVLLFENGEGSKTISVTLQPDDIAEGPETFFINITSVLLLSPSDNDFTSVDGLQRDMPPGIGPVRMKTIIIEQNDNAEGIIEFKNSSVIVQEEAGVAHVPVIRRVGSYGTVTMSYTTQPISATPGVDYLPSAGIVQFGEGQEIALINVTLVDDNSRESDEEFSITLSSPTGGAQLGNVRTAVVTIAKSDFPNGKFSFLGETVRSIPNPNSPQNLVLNVERTEGLLGQQKVSWRIMGPNNPNVPLVSTGDISYTSSGVETTSGSFTWNDGEAGSKQFTLTVKPYTSWEIAKTFVIEIYNIQGSPATVGNGEASPTAGQVQLTVEKFGDPNGIIQFTGVATTVRELQEPPGSEPQELAFPVTRRQNTGMEGVVMVHWEVRGPDKELTDVRPQNGTLILADEQRSGQIILQILPDDVPELTEQFTLVITHVEGGAELDTQASQSVFRIGLNDNPHGLFGVLAENQQVVVDPQDFSRSLALNFSRYSGTFGGAILTYNIVYSKPLSGVILPFTTGKVTFGDGQGNVLESVPIQGSGFLQLDSIFTLSLIEVQATGQVTQRPQLKTGQTEAKFRVPPLAANSEVGFLHNIVNVDDAASTATLTITRSGVYGTITVDWLAGQPVASLPTGVTNGQITPTGGSVSIAHGIDSENFTVQVNPRLGQAEIFLLRLPQVPQTPVSGGARLGQQNVTELDPEGMVRFMPNSLRPEVSETVGQVTVSVCRVYGVSGRIAVTYSTADITAQGNVDYSSLSNIIVNMDPGQAVINITVPITNDNIPEQSEQFNINLLKVDQLPTPTQPIISPRLNQQFKSSVVTITESNDPYGVLWFEPDVITVQERHQTVSLVIKRTGGQFGTVTVRVRSVGGGETWTSGIVINTDNSTRDTIGQALGQRSADSAAEEGKDYTLLDAVVEFKAGESTKTVDLLLLEDDTPEPQETVLVYLTQVTGGARIATGGADGGQKGFAEIIIRANDLSNGLIGFAENSKNVEVNEDINSVVTLTLTRINMFYGNVMVFWMAKMREDSTEEEDRQLNSQLQAVSGNTTCLAHSSVCTLEVHLIDDPVPEGRWSFVVMLERVGDDAQVNTASRFATVTVLDSDYFRGLVQFEPRYSITVVGDQARSVTLGVTRVKGQGYDVTVGYRTRTMERYLILESGITVNPAKEGEDYQRASGVLVFRAQSAATQYISVTLGSGSTDSYPKQFYVDLHDPTNGASISQQYGTASVRIVKEGEEDVYRIVDTQLHRPFNNTNLLQTLVGLDGQADKELTGDEVTLIDDLMKKINEEGSSRKLPDDVMGATLSLLCKMLDPNRAEGDGTKGQYSLTVRMEEFANNLLTGQNCPGATSPKELITKECRYAVVSAGRWQRLNVEGYTYDQERDTFGVPNRLTVSNTADGTDDQCVDFHIIEYNSRQWFPTPEGQELLNNKILSFGLKGQESGRTSDPAKFRIYSGDNRIVSKQAQCTYFDMSSGSWVLSDLCQVESNVKKGTDTFVDCACSHMTNYAVLTSDTVGFPVWFYVSCLICMTCIVLVIASHHLCNDRPTFAASLLQHMLFAVFAVQLCLILDAFFSPTEILVTTDKDDNYRCIVMGVFLHYVFLAQFMWIMVQAINFWKILVMNDEHTERNYVACFVLGWGTPLLYVAAFYAVTFNVYKYTTSLPVDFIYGNVNSNNEICFLTNPYAALGGIIVPVLLLLFMSGVIFIKAFQLLPQWQAYDDIYRGRYNITEVQLLLFLWALLVLTWLWGSLRIVYTHLWLMVLFCICNVLLGLFVLVIYAILRNPCFKRCAPGQKSYYTPSNTANTDVGILPPPSLSYSNRLAVSNNTINMLKGSQTSLINDAWERETLGSRSGMTVRRALPSQVYINPPPITIISPAATSELDPKDFDDLLFALKSGHDYTPSELSRSIADDDSQLSTKLDRYETKRIDIADTHL